MGLVKLFNLIALLSIAAMLSNTVCAQVNDVWLSRLLYNRKKR